jgi:Tfp pilus assembly protein PilO
MLHNTGVDYDAVRPLPDRRRQLFTEMPYLIDSNAAFHEFGQFLNLIEENPNRFMRVSHIDVTNSREHPTVHPANLEITTFTLHDVPTGNER